MERDGTNYQLARTSADYKACHEFLKASNTEYCGKLKFPTFIAKREDKIVAVMGTHPTDKMILVEPLEIQVEGNPSFLMQRLVNLYEGLLVSSGVSTYRFRIRKEHDRYLNVIRQLPALYKELEPENNSSEFAWFERRLQ